MSLIIKLIVLFNKTIGKFCWTKP